MRLATKLFVTSGVLTLLLWAGAFWLVQRTIDASFERIATNSFDATRHGLQGLQNERINRMRQACRLVMNIPELRALIAEQSNEVTPENQASLQERLDYLRTMVRARFVHIIDARQKPVAQSHASPWNNLSELDQYLRKTPQPQALTKRLFSNTASTEGEYGIWPCNGALYHVIAMPLVFDAATGGKKSRVEGALVMAIDLGNELAMELGKSHNCEVSFICNNTLAASSLPPNQQNELGTIVRAGLPPVSDGFSVQLSGVSYDSSIEPLIDPSSTIPVGATLIQTDRSSGKLVQHKIARTLLLIMLSGLILAAIVSFIMNSAITHPIHDLVEGVRKVAQGDLETSLCVTSRDELGELADAFNDMVSQLRTRRDLKKVAEEALAANQAKSSFLANMSHEIRTPMTAILGYTDLLLETNLSDVERLEHIDTIRRNGEHLMTILNDILDLSKIEADKMKIEKIDCSPGQLVSDVAAMMRGRAAAKKLKFDVQYFGVIPQSIHSDPTRIRQILINLIGNAIKFTDSGSVRLTVQFLGDPVSGGRRMRFDVIDTGVGLSVQQISRLFQPFTQADSSTTRRFGGTGLGLTICRRLAEMLGGEIGVASTLGHGSTFYVIIDTGDVTNIPMVSGVSEANDGSPVPATGRTQRLHGRLLLAEDGVDNQKLIAHLLTKAGANVTIANNGRSAVDMVMQAQRDGSPFDAVLMDMQMPVMDGYTAAGLLKEQGCTSPVIALTAHAMAEDRAKCIASGCADYLSKPINKQQLLETVGAHLKKCGDPMQTIEPQLIDEDVKQFLPDFLDSLPAKVVSLQTYLRRRDIDNLALVLHQLKGSGGTFGFMQITDAAADAEAKLKENRNIEAAAAEVKELVRLIELIKDYPGANAKTLAKKQKS